MLELFWAHARTRTTETRRRPPQYDPPKTTPPANDEWIEKVKKLPDVRQEKVRAIRKALQAGEYDLETRLNQLFDKLPEKLGQPADHDQST